MAPRHPRSRRYQKRHATTPLLAAYSREWDSLSNATIEEIRDRHAPDTTPLWTLTLYLGPSNMHPADDTDRTLTIFYEDPDPPPAASPEQQEERNALAELVPGQNTNFNIPGSRNCAVVPIQAIDEDGVVVDSLPEGTWHDDDYVRWTITDDQ